jgi:hypothetical protein
MGGSIPLPGTNHLYFTDLMGRYMRSSGYHFVQWYQSFINQIPGLSKKRCHTVFNLCVEIAASLLGLISHMIWWMPCSEASVVRRPTGSP